MGGFLEFGDRDQFLLQSVVKNASVLNKWLRTAFNETVELFMRVEKSHDDVIHREQSDGADDTTGDRVIVTDDCVLNGIGKRQQYDQIERIELGQFAFSCEAQRHDKE